MVGAENAFKRTRGGDIFPAPFVIACIYQSDEELLESDDEELLELLESDE